jgi:hypothetical protein
MPTRKMTELEQRMTNDLDWAEHAPEVQENPEHYGKFVIVCNKRILAVGTDRQALAKQAAEQVGLPWQHRVEVIVHRPGLWEIPHGLSALSARQIPPQRSSR